MARQNLTDRFIRSRKPAPAGQRHDYPDAVVPGMALRVTDRGHKSFVLIARYPSNPSNPTRRALGDYGAISLDQARTRARDWLDLIGKGVDPKAQEARERALQLRRQENTFAAVAAEFLDRHASSLSKADEARRIIETEFGSRWNARPVTEIMPEEVAAAIRAIVKRGAPYQAHNAMGYLRRMFNWAIGTHEFGLTVSPLAQLKPKDLIGKRKERERILSDVELRAVWEAAGEMGYPYGPLFRTMILTGQRETEIAEMHRLERDLVQKLWTIPGERMKGGRAHEVPLAPDALKELSELPEFSGGPFVFTTTGGKKPVNGFSKAKRRLDRLTLGKLSAAAREAGDAHAVAHWDGILQLLEAAGEGDEAASAELHDRWFVLHDLRRTMRTHLSALPVEDLVRELVIAHAKPELHKVYDQYRYREEKRRCLELWEARLAGIVRPKTAGIIDLAEVRARAS